MLVAIALPSRPLKLRLLYLFAASALARAMDESSALMARLCPGLVGPVRSVSSGGKEPWVGVAVEERWVGVEAPVGMLVDESVLPAPRL
jgi:hypothetical protein